MLLKLGLGAPLFTSFEYLTLCVHLSSKDNVSIFYQQ